MECFGNKEVVTACAEDIAKFLIEEDGAKVGYSAAEVKGVLAPEEIVGLWFAFWTTCRIGAGDKKKLQTVLISPMSKIRDTTIVADVETVSSLRGDAENHFKTLDPITQEKKKCDVHDTPSTPPL